MTDPGPALLPARSVLLSLLLGSHPPRLPVRTLVKTAGLFGISEGTTRVALSRLTADGDVAAEQGVYRLSDRHLERQHTQDEALRPPRRPWRGGWYLAVTLPAMPESVLEAAPDATASGSMIRETREQVHVAERWRMAELRPGVWTRPDNLTIPDVTGTQSEKMDMLVWRGRPVPERCSAEELAGRLWDLSGWAERADRLVDELSAAEEPAVRLSVAAAMVRHIRSDPVLPASLLPERWPGRRLRRAYDGYRAELGRLIAELRDD